jgi:hypothetical protein
MLSVRYTGNRHDVLRYCCIRGSLDNGEPRCIGFGGITADEAIGREILRVVQPAAIEASKLAHEERVRQKDDVLGRLNAIDKPHPMRLIELADSMLRPTRRTGLLPRN